MKTTKIVSLILLVLATLSIKNTYTMISEKQTNKILKATTTGDTVNLKKILDSRDGDILLNARYTNNETLLHLAVAKEQPKTVDELLKRNINLQATNIQGDTALDFAMQIPTNKKIKVIQEIIYERLSEEEKLFFNIKYQKTEEDEKNNILNLMDKITNHSLDVNKTYYNGWTLVHASVFAQSINILKILEKHNALLTAKTNKNRNPLEIALDNKKSSQECIQYLVRADLKVAGDEKLRQKLNDLVKGKDLNEVKKYIKDKIDINIYYEGTTPLHEAIKTTFDDKMAILLIEKGANINATDKNENTPLHLAVIIGKSKVVAHLLSKGADPKAKNINNQDVYDLIKIRSTEDAVKPKKDFVNLQFWAMIQVASQSKTKMTAKKIMSEANKIVKKIALTKKKTEQQKQKKIIEQKKKIIELAQKKKELEEQKKKIEKKKKEMEEKKEERIKKEDEELMKKLIEQAKQKLELELEQKRKEKEQEKESKKKSVAQKQLV